MDPFSDDMKVVAKFAYRDFQALIFEGKRGAVHCETRHELSETWCKVCKASIAPVAMFLPLVFDYELIGTPCDTANEAAEAVKAFVDMNLEADATENQSGGKEEREEPDPVLIKQMTKLGWPAKAAAMFRDRPKKKK